MNQHKERAGIGGTRLLHFFIAAVVVTVFVLLPANYAPGADDLRLELSLNRSQIHLGEQALLRITVSGPSGFSEPALPETEGIEFKYRGRTQSVQIINTKIESSKVFSYTALPSDTGEFVLGPARIERSGQTFESNAVTLTVMEPGRQEGTADSGNGVLVEASVDNLTPYKGEQITLLFRFARRADVHVRNASYELPHLESFWSEGLESRREYRQNIKGEPYVVTEIAIPLFPMEEGETGIGRIRLHYEQLVPTNRSRLEHPSFTDPFGRNLFDDDFFQLFRSEDIVRRTLYTNPIPIKVRPLPVADQPEDYKGGVGSFSMTTRLDRDQAKVGESATLTLTLSGEGNIRDIEDPHIRIDGVKIYSDSPSTNVKNYHDTVVGEKVYRLALVPQRQGEIKIPTISIPYFNPETERYEVASSAPMKLTVLPSEKESIDVAKPGTDEQPGEPTKQDILPIHERIGPIKINRTEAWLRRIRPAAYPLPLLIYALCFITAKRRERLKTDVAYRRYKFASKTSDMHMKKARQAFREKKWDDFFAECSRAVTDYLADRLNVPPHGLTPSDIRSVLSEKNVSDRFVNEITEFLEACDYARFATPQKSASWANKYMERAYQIIDRLEKEEVIRQ